MFEPIHYRILYRLQSAESILDIGCGDGRLVSFLAYHTRRRVFGLDVSSQGFTKAYKRAMRGHIAERVE